MGHAHALQGPRPVPVELGHGLRAAVQGLRGPALRERPADHHRISPELVLVCPELRAEALARLPDRDPDGFVPAPVRTPVEPTPSPQAAFPAASHPGAGRLALAAGVHAAVEAARTAAFGAGFTACLVGLMTAAELLRG